jgi:hypothetical protein
LFSAVLVPAAAAATVSGSFSPSTITLRTSSSFRWGSDRPQPGLNPCLPSHATEKTGLRLTEHDEFGIVLRDAQQVEHDLFCLCE